MLAPILAFTADEAWEFVPGKTVDSAHRLTWQPLGFERPEAERATWKALFELRELALPELEKARQAKANRQGAGGEADVRRLQSRADGRPERIWSRCGSC